MRIALSITVVVALAALQPASAETVVAGGAAIVLECLPYLVASALIAPMLRGRAPALLAYAGCGCGSGPSARSIPAAIATALIFGPFVAVARVVVAASLARALRTRAHRQDATLADACTSLAPSALLAAFASAIASTTSLSAQPTIVQLVAGLLLGLCASPCALGSVALAASLHTVSPPAAYAILATAGFIDTRRWLPHAAPGGHDTMGYLLLAVACWTAASHGGAQLVNPRLTLALFACAPYFATLALRARGSTNTSARVIAAVLVAAVVIGAPSPTYRATETTLDDTFAGESIDFTGRYLQADGRAFVERYAITCCRADAAPVALELAHPLSTRDMPWVNVVGTIATVNGRSVLRVDRHRVISPPSDPFIYR